MRQQRDWSGESGLALVHMAIVLPVMLLFTGLAVDSGRAYVVKAQLSKAVDGAALGAARMLNSGNPRAEAGRIFTANFPPGLLGVTSVTNPTTDPDFFAVRTEEETGVNVVTIRATAVVPTSFMRLGSISEVMVASSGEATRRMVDLSLVLDVSGSIGADWPAVRDAARAFVDAFDVNGDRMSLVLYGNGARVVDPMPGSRGFDKSRLKADIPNSLPGGTTAMPEGLYRGWDELRTVSNGQQSGLRVIVLFTDGSGNVAPGMWDASGVANGIYTGDFPKVLPDPWNLTTDRPSISGLYDTETGARTGAFTFAPAVWSSTSTAAAMPFMPASSFHAHHRSSGIPVTFPWQTNALTVNGAAQSTRRGLRNFNESAGKYPAEVWNLRNGVTNLTEIVANAARSDTSGDYRIRIYTIGMGSLVRMPLGTIPETSESVLMRVANDVRSPDHNADHLEGKYYFAATAADLAPVFQQLQNQIIRLSK
jgi:Flp pilus assembly protein TadG